MERPRSGGFHGRVYRHAHPAHGDLDATLLGSRRVGGRFNPPGDFGAVYFSLERSTAERELLRLANRMAVRPAELAPRTLFTFDVGLVRVLDLTDDETRSAWLLAPSDLAADDWTRCQELGRAAREKGIEAIIFPSATGSGRNLVVFLDRLAEGSHVALHASEPLDLETVAAR